MTYIYDAFDCSVIYCSPSVTSFPVDSETAVDPVIDYFTVEDSYLSAEQPGKQTPLDHSYIAHSFSPMLALDFATVIDCSYSDAHADFVTCC